MRCQLSLLTDKPGVQGALAVLITELTLFLITFGINLKPKFCTKIQNRK
jgi:hypothetical protein